MRASKTVEVVFGYEDITVSIPSQMRASKTMKVDNYDTTVKFPYPLK